MLIFLTPIHSPVQVLRPDFSELRAVTADQLMYVKEDLIIPQTNTFYDFIVTKVGGKKVINVLYALKCRY